MGLSVKSPSTIVDLANLSQAFDPISWMVVREMWREGDSFTLFWDGEAIALANLYPRDDGSYEGTFNFAPEARKHMLAIVRQIRLTLSERPYAAIMTVCASNAGKRLARAVGFEFAHAVPHGEVYVYDRADFWRWRAQAGVGKTTAPITG